MTRDVATLVPESNLAQAAEMMWNADCGALPVLSEGKLTGIVTDRDICIALGTRNHPASEILVKDVATPEVQTAAADASVQTAMSLMRRAKVRRLPVLEDGKLVGLLALNDIVDAVDRKHGEIDYEDVLNTVKAVSEHRALAHTATASVSPTQWPPIPAAVA
jgi:signal-transduction protein with cAMP-binding, CBS, and nucleotidyltransferase domain